MLSQRLTDLMQSTAADDDIKFFFITNNGSIDEATDEMKLSFQIIADFASTTENLQWLSETDCLGVVASSLTKENVFVLENFEGPAFDHLSSTKAIILGPKVLIRCQSSNDVVPNTPSPIFTLAMKDYIVCVSGIADDKRKEIHKLVGFMGGLTSQGLLDSTTHLVSNTVKSPKYEKAVKGKMKIMKEDWVADVWKLSKNDDDAYTTDEFYQSYKLPIFHKLVITSTGLTEAEKKEIVKLINDNGGTYSGSFKSKITDILITQPNQRNSDKFKAAVKCRKECLLADWVKDSVSKGYALPFVNYRIYTGQPNKTDVLNSTQVTNQTLRGEVFNPDGTQLSVILSEISVAETTYGLTPKKTTSVTQSSYKAILDTIDVGVVKNAKGCLDGCTIWLCGFDGPCTDKLKKIINIGGGTRIDEHGPDVDYAIVGKPNSAELSNLKSLESSNIVTVNWLVACITEKRIVDAKEFIFKVDTPNADSTAPSPATRKNIEDMNPTRRGGYTPRTLHLANDDERIQDDNEKTLLEQYAGPSNAQVNVQPSNSLVQRAESSADTVDKDSNEIDPNLFVGRTFALFAFSEESTVEMSDEIEAGGGSVVTAEDFTTIVDYLVVPVNENDISGCEYKAKEIVTDLWIQDCLADNKVVDIQYFHRAILPKPDCKPLTKTTIVISTYTTPERDYLINLAEALGADVNDRFIRGEKPILICPTPKGKKYEGAVKWNLPAVTSDWLKQCLELECKAPIKSYLVCNSESDDVESDDVGNADERVIKDENETRTPIRHPRISTIKNADSRRSVKESPKTPLRSSSTVGEENVMSPLTEMLSDAPIEVRQMLYDRIKERDANETPLTKRRRLEAATSSPMAAFKPPDIFEKIDKDFVEVPERRKSTPFVEYRKKMFRHFLGDRYDGSPLRGPINCNDAGGSSGQEKPSDQLEENRQANQQPDVSIVEKNDSVVKDAEKKSGDGNTQVQEFIKSVKKLRDSRESHTMTQQIPQCELNDPSSDTEEERPNEQPQQTEEIDWRDPEDFFQSERFHNTSRSTFKGTMHFSMSSSTIDTEIMQKIEALGGMVCKEYTSFDPNCTHYICAKPNQSEKTLSIVASGRWLLCPAYIENSSKAGHWLNEEEYEWGNPKAKANIPIDELDEKSRKIATASHKWRKELQLKSKAENRPVGMFSGFRAIVHAPKKDSLKRLLEAGCGIVVDLKEPYSEQEDFRGITHCFIDNKKMKRMPESEMDALRKAGVHLVTLMYLQACLQLENMPSVKDFEVK